MFRHAILPSLLLPVFAGPPTGDQNLEDRVDAWRSLRALGHDEEPDALEGR